MANHEGVEQAVEQAVEATKQLMAAAVERVRTFADLDGRAIEPLRSQEQAALSEILVELLKRGSRSIDGARLWVEVDEGVRTPVLAYLCLAPILRAEAGGSGRKVVFATADQSAREKADALVERVHPMPPRPADALHWAAFRPDRPHGRDPGAYLLVGDIDWGREDLDEDARARVRLGLQHVLKSKAPVILLHTKGASPILEKERATEAPKLGCALLLAAMSALALSACWLGG